jgi:thioredoxin
MFTQELKMSFIKKLFGLEETKQPSLVNDENYKNEVIKSELPVVLDLWSPGCGPCNQLAPIMTSLTNKYDGKIKIAHCDISSSPQIARKLGVRGTPTVVYFKKGKEVDRVVGFRGSLYHTEVIETDLLGNDFIV